MSHGGWAEHSFGEKPWVPFWLCLLLAIKCCISQAGFSPDSLPVWSVGAPVGDWEEMGEESGFLSSIFVSSKTAADSPWWLQLLCKGLVRTLGLSKLPPYLPLHLHCGCGCWLLPQGYPLSCLVLCLTLNNSVAQALRSLH